MTQKEEVQGSSVPTSSVGRYLPTKILISLPSHRLSLMTLLLHFNAVLNSRYSVCLYLSSLKNKVDGMGRNYHVVFNQLGLVLCLIQWSACKQNSGEERCPPLPLSCALETVKSTSVDQEGRAKTDTFKLHDRGFQVTIREDFPTEFFDSGTDCLEVGGPSFITDFHSKKLKHSPVAP